MSIGVKGNLFFKNEYIIKQLKKQQISIYSDYYGIRIEGTNFGINHRWFFIIYNESNFIREFMYKIWWYVNFDKSTIDLVYYLIDNRQILGIPIHYFEGIMHILIC